MLVDPRTQDGMGGPGRRLGLALLLALSAILMGAGPASAAGPSADLDQCRNGTVTAPQQCSGSAWVNGNLGEQNAHYREGDSTPFRARLDGLSTSGSHTLAIEYDTLASGAHAYDYLTSYNRTETTAAPCSGVSPCVPGAAGAIPVDPTIAFSNPSASQLAGSVSIWNGAITSVMYGSSDPSGKRSVSIAFTASNSSVVIAWGGHIASQHDWGPGHSAGAISGSPYHVRLLSLDRNGTGNQDRSMKSSTILPVPATFTTLASSATVDTAQPVTDAAMLSGPNGPVSGSVTFFVCGPELVANPDCSWGGAQVGGAVVFANGSASSSAFMPSLAGRYCFRAEYAPDQYAAYSPGSHTNTTTECFAASVPTGRLEVKKMLSPASDPGRFDLLVDGTARALAVGDGGSTGELGVAAGSHTLGEAGAGGTSLSDYDAAIACTDGNGTTVAQSTGSGPLSVLVAKNADVVCTIANTRKPPPPPAKATLTVIKHVINDDGGTKTAPDFSLRVSGPNASPSSFAGSESGTEVELDAGGYSVTEGDVAGYTASYSAACSGSLAAGGSATCTVTNNDSPPPPPAKATLTVVKHVVNDDGGTKTASDFELRVSGVNASPASFNGSEDGTTVELAAGEYSVSETPVDGYTGSLSDNCSGTIAAGESRTCAITNDDDEPPPPAKATLTVIKHVINDDGGTKTAGDFVLHASGDNASPASFSGSEAGTKVELDSGRYAVTEDPVGGYTATYSEGCNGRIAAGGQATCTVTNNDDAPPPPAKATLTVIKHVINDDGGTKIAADFTLQVSGSNASPSNFAGAENGVTITLDAGSYAVTETAVAGYTAGYSADCSGSIAAGGQATCTVTNNDDEAPPPPPPSPPASPPSVPAPAAATPPTPTAPTPTATAPVPTQTVDLSIVKRDAPDPAFVGGRLVYTLTVRNAGPARATNVGVTDELPAAVAFVSVTTTQGKCTGGRRVTCSLGTLEVGASATILIIVRPLSPGLVLNTARVAGAEADPNLTNNRSTAPTLIEGPFAPPPVRCPSLTVAKRTIPVGQRSTVTARAYLDRIGIRGMRLTIRGPGINKTARTGAGGRARIVVRPRSTGIVEIRMTGKARGCSVRRIGVVGIFRPPSLTG